MPGLRREFQKNNRLATHTALGELFIPDEYEECKGVFTELSGKLKFTPSNLRYETSTAR